MREETIRISQEELQRQRDFARQVRCHPDRPKSYYIVTYGCQMNAHDSLSLRRSVLPPILCCTTPAASAIMPSARRWAM